MKEQLQRAFDYYAEQKQHMWSVLDGLALHQKYIEEQYQKDMEKIRKTRAEVNKNIEEYTRLLGKYEDMIKEEEERTKYPEQFQYKNMIFYKTHTGAYECRHPDMIFRICTKQTEADVAKEELEPETGKYFVKILYYNERKKTRYVCHTKKEYKAVLKTTPDKLIEVNGAYNAARLIDQLFYSEKGEN